MANLPLYSLLFLLFILLIKFLHQTRTRITNLPPSPPSLPILGHLHLFRTPFHRCLFNLSQKYGPIFSLRLGSRLAVIVSSPSAVEECYTRNDILIANRPSFWISEYIGYNNTILTTSPYGDHWRKLRRICKHELLSTNCLNMSSTIRMDETRNSLQEIYHLSSSDSSFVKVELKSVLVALAFNIFIKMVVGNINQAKKHRLQEVIEEIHQLANLDFVGDFIPFLQWLDFQRYKKNVFRITKKKDALLQDLIDEHRIRRKGASENENTMIDHLLSLQESQPEYYTDEIIKGLLQDILAAGTETSTITLEWAMANLLNNPSALEKTRAELDSIIGQEKLLEEADLPKLQYLRNVISESLRLHPVAPLLSPRTNSESCTIGNYSIPKGTMLLVNAWAIQRDPNLWDEATSFKPERFESGGSISGAYKMMPFGLGRRACPGMDLGLRLTNFVLGLLIQLFEWERVDQKEIGLAEGKLLVLTKAEPLEAMCKARNIANKLLF